jgi:DNA-binding NtrC family response regulator
MLSQAGTPAPNGTPQPILAELAVLIIDDEPGMRNFMGRILGPQCRRVETAASTAEAADWLSVEVFDVIVLDNHLGNERGLDWLAARRAQRPVPPVVLISAHADLEVAIAALQAGAGDLILKPFRSAQLVAALLRSAAQARAGREKPPLPIAAAPAVEGHAPPRQWSLDGSSAAISAVRAIIAQVAPQTTSVLLTGASGTGKEVAARMIHALSPRAKAAFVVVNCAALSTESAEYELFGHVEGAFPGAASHRSGLFLQANGGTLFLDEISGLSPQVQAGLLRVIEDHRIRPQGAEAEIPLNLRLIFATHADLRAEVASGRFRADLYHRINVLQIAMPPLSARGDDVVELARLFLSRRGLALGRSAPELTPELAQALRARDWPGNIRELRNLVERAIILGGFEALASGQGPRDDG